MVDLTSPDNIPKWTGDDPVSLVQESQTQGSAIQAALDKRQRYDFKWDDAGDRTAQTGMLQGSRGYQIDTKTDYIYDNSNWRLQVPYALYTYTTQSISTSATWTLLGTSAYDSGLSTDSTFVTTSANGKFTVVNPGLYSVSMYFKFSASWDGRRFVDLHIGDVSAGDVNSIIMRGSSMGPDDTLSFAMPNLRVATSNQIYTLSAFQDSGSSKTYTADLNWTRLA